MDKKLSISEVSKIYSVSIRTLHYYDQIGLVCPKANPENEYREYSEENLNKLEQVFFFKELNFKLSDIKQIISDKKFDRDKALLVQKRLLNDKKKNLNKAIELIDDLLNNKNHMKSKKVFGELKNIDIRKYREMYEKEVEEKYGYVEKRTDETLVPILKEGGKIFEEISKLMDLKPSDPRVQSLIKEWQVHITRSFYECTNEILKGLGEMYMADERFKTNIDKIKPGLAQFISDAIRVYVG